MAPSTLRKVAAPFVNPGIFDFWVSKLNPAWSWDRPLARVVDRKVEVFGALAPLHLDEGERFAAPRDEVDLARGNAEPLPENAPAVQAQPPCRAPFGPAAPRFGGGAVQARSFNASARA